MWRELETVFHELIVRLYCVFVIHTLVTQKSFKVKHFGRNTEKYSFFSFPFLKKSNKDETAYEWSSTTMTDMEEGLLLFGC